MVPARVMEAREGERARHDGHLVLDAAVDACLQELLAGGPQAQREIKALFSQLEVGPVTEEVRELTAQTISRVRGSDEAREGFAAFLDKRPPTWIPE